MQRPKAANVSNIKGLNCSAVREHRRWTESPSTQFTFGAQVRRTPQRLRGHEQGRRPCERGPREAKKADQEKSIFSLREDRPPRYSIEGGTSATRSEVTRSAFAARAEGPSPYKRPSREICLRRRKQISRSTDFKPHF